MNTSQEKRPLCREKQNCKLFKSGKKCNFRHDLCKFGKKCSKPDCRYTHAEIKHNSKFPTSVKHAPCKFGIHCTKRLTGECHFNHDDISTNAGNAPPAKKQMCRFGKDCTFFKKGTCRFDHGEPAVFAEEIPVDNQTQSSTILVTKDENYENLCEKYLSNTCFNEECEQKHQFAKDGSFKRIFHTSLPISEGGCFRLFKVNNKIVYMIQDKKTLSFMSLSDQVKLLRSATEFEICERENIRKTFLQPDCIIYILETQICVYKYTDGTITRFQFPNMERVIDIIGWRQNTFAMILNNGIQMVTNGHTQRGLTDKLNAKLRQEEIRHISFAKMFKIGDDKGFLIGGENKLLFCNEDLQTYTENFAQEKVVDICFFKYDHHPYCLLANIESDGSSCLYSIDMVSLKKEKIFKMNSMETDVKIQKIRVVNGKVLLQAKNVGILLYKLPYFNEKIGLIPATKITSFDTDEDGWVLLVEERQNTQYANVFRVRND